MGNKDIIDIDALMNILPIQYGKRFFSKILGLCIRLSRLNRQYSQLKHLDALGVIDQMFSTLNIQIENHGPNFQSSLDKEPLIVVANHPTGFLEILILFKLLLPLGREVKIMANQLLNLEPQHSQHIIPVDAFNSNAAINKCAYKEAIQALARGAIILFFPSGKVSNYRQHQLQEDEWNPSFLMLALRCHAKIMPIYIDAQNPLWFYNLYRISPFLRLPFIPAMLYRHKNKTIHCYHSAPLIINANDSELLQEEAERYKTLTFSLKNKQ